MESLRWLVDRSSCSRELQERSTIFKPDIDPDKLLYDISRSWRLSALLKKFSGKGPVRLLSARLTSFRLGHLVKRSCGTGPDILVSDRSRSLRP